jgi:hypothetical protein
MIEEKAGLVKKPSRDGLLGRAATKVTPKKKKKKKTAWEHPSDAAYGKALQAKWANKEKA